MSTQDCLKKAILDTQERVRDFMEYSNKMDNQKLKEYFKECAETEGFQANQLRQFLNELE